MSTESLFRSTLTPEDVTEIKKLPGPILVVGAGGFIGAHILFQLLLHREDVFGLIRTKDLGWRLQASPPGVDLSKHLRVGDITDKANIRSVVERIRPQVIFNLSAYGAYERQSDSHKIHDVNYMGLLNLIEVLQETGCFALVQAGSSSEYGLNATAPKEDAPLLPNSHYAVSKGAAALMIKFFGIKHDFPCVNLRLYSIYGPWEDRNRLIPTLVNRALEGKYPSLANPDISRDFVYVDDCLRAFVRAAVTVCRNRRGASLNVCAGRKVTLAALAQTAREVFRIPGEPNFGSMAPRRWDLTEWYGTGELAASEMNWRPRVDLSTGLRLTAEWETAAHGLLQGTKTQPQQKKISAVIACYRDAQAIPIMYERLKQAITGIGCDYEIIFVNDNSPENDAEEIARICERDISVIGVSHSRNFGSQAAFVSGMELATGDAVVLLDGDLQDPPEMIPELAQRWQEGYDVVYGVRVQREAPLHMRFFYKAFYRLFSRMAEVTIPKDAGDFSLIDRKVVDKLLQLPERDMFLRGLRAWVGFRQTGVPYVRPERMFGVTTNNFTKNIWWAKKAIFSFSSKPLDLMQAAGLAVTVLSFSLGVFYIVYSIFIDESRPQGFTTIVVLSLGLGGLQILAISILGEYIKKILEEVKSRPKFIRTSVTRGRVSYSEAEYLAREGKRN